MDAYIEYIKINFPNITVFQIVMGMTIIIISNRIIIKENIFKIIIGNFITNAKYISSIKTFLVENKIKLKNLQDYNLKECVKIIVLLSDIVFLFTGKI